LVPQAHEKKIVAAVEEAFAANGYIAPKSFIAKPSAGAQIEV
jgi:hypothetical protein